MLWRRVFSVPSDRRYRLVDGLWSVDDQCVDAACALYHVAFKPCIGSKERERVLVIKGIVRTEDYFAELVVLALAYDILSG